MTTKQLKLTVIEPATLIELLAQQTGLSKSKLKQALQAGAAQIRQKGKMRRVRRATQSLSIGDKIEFNYNEQILSIKPKAATLVADLTQFTVWNKPSGMLSQGNQWGDHLSLLRMAETYFTPSRPVFLVHRLDRETQGLMIIAHQKQAAAQLSEMFQKNSIKKTYNAVVLGKTEEQGTITQPLDGKSAITNYICLGYNPEKNSSTLKVTIETGRTHQIRRHLELIGHPIIGDPTYGKGNKNKEGLKLFATELEFINPWTKQALHFKTPEELSL